MTNSTLVVRIINAYDIIYNQDQKKSWKKQHILWFYIL